MENMAKKFLDKFRQIAQASMRFLYGKTVKET